MWLELTWILRGLRKERLLSTLVVLVLAVGIGSNTAVFSIVDAVLLRPPPFAEPERLVRVEERSSSLRNLTGPVPARDYLNLVDQTPDVFERVSPFLRDTVTITGDGEPEQLVAVRSLGLFPLLGVRAQLGRTLSAADDAGESATGGRRAVVLSDRLWQRRYRGDPAAVGRRITISDEVCEVVGILPRDFEFRFAEADLWTALPPITESTPWLQVAGRLGRGVSVERAQSAMDLIARRMEQEHPKDRANLRISVTPWRETPEQKYQSTLILVLVAVGLVMLIVCADVSGLLLSRALQRRREIIIRASLGAGFWRIARSLVFESLLLTMLGGFAGTILAWVLVQVLTDQLARLPIQLPHLQSAAMNSRAAVFNLLLCVVTALLCSVPAVLIASRSDLQSMLRGGGPSAAGAALGGRPSRVFSALIALQTGFAFLLLVGSGLILHSLVRLQRADHGIQPDHVLTLRVPVGTLSQPRPSGKYDTRPRQMAYYREILERVRRVPGIRTVAIVNNPPLSDIRSSLMFRLNLEETGKAEIVSSRTVSPQYFASMGIPILAGRDFTEGDQSGKPDVAIINEFLAQRLFPNRSPLGERLRGESVDRPGPEIVGVARNAPQMSYEAPPGPEIYIPYQQFIFATFMSTLVVRTEPAVDLESMSAAIRKQVWSVDPAQPIVKVQTMNEVIERAIWRPRFSAWIFSILSGFAVLLTALGVYGIVAYTAALRKQEVGVRIALGATPRDVGWVFLRGVLTPLLIGLAVSAITAMFLSQLLTGLLYEVQGTDPLTYVLAAAVILGFGIAASIRPTWQAATQDPLQTLRGQ